METSGISTPHSGSTHLAVVIDISPNTALIKREDGSYLRWMDSVVAFCNSHMLLDHRNQLTVIASNFDENAIIFPDPNNEQSLESTRLNGQYDVFHRITNVVQSRIKQMVSDSKKKLEQLSSSGQQPNEPNFLITNSGLTSLMAGALAIALCRIRATKDQVRDSRICILTAGKENPSFYASQYMNFMNVYFSAQKMDVAIDVCFTALDEQDEHPTSAILQQGCDLTNGLYLKIANVAGLLEYLMWVFLPDVESRKKLILPNRKKASYRAACFCHRNYIEVGYVCSVCLSIFCTFNPICSTCQTVFKLGPVPTDIKIKRRR